MEKKYGKLVRDKIPAIIEGNGQQAAYTVLPDEQYRAALEEKLREELAEYLESGALEELADLLEVIEAVCRARGSTWEEVLAIKEEKCRARGAFEKRYFLLSVTTPDARQ